MIEIINSELAKRRDEYKGKFSTQTHYFGYEGRCAFPSNFDCDYCYCLGVNAAILIEKGFTGVMSVIRGLAEEPENWQPAGYPLVTMMTVEIRHGKPKPVIKKALVELEGEIFKIFSQERKKWALEDRYRSLGPIQFEFQQLTPFLVKSPNYENIYSFVTKDYNQNSPFCQIDPRYNVSELGFERAKTIAELPSCVAENSYVVVKQHPLQF